MQTELILSRKQEKAAQLVAADEIDDREIATVVGVHVVTLERWKKRQEFISRVQAQREAWAEKIMTKGLARREKRVEALTDLYDRMDTIIQERSNDPTMEKVEGGRTGLILRTYKSLPSKQGPQIIPEYEADVGLVREMRATQEQIAVECGHRLGEVGAGLTAIQISVVYESKALRNQVTESTMPELEPGMPELVIERIPRDGHQN